MLGWFHRLMPREERFFELFRRHSETIVAGAKELRSMLDGGEAVERHYPAVLAREEDADAITRDIMLAVRRTFITPFDRGDIQTLIGAMDDSIEQIKEIEGRADDVHDSGLTRLFERCSPGNAMQFIANNEVYDHLEKVVDRFDDIANEIQSIVVEHV